MNRSSTLYLVLIFTLIFAISCSGGSGNVTAPGSADRDVVSDAQSNGTLCTGLWQVVADKATGNVDVVQLRSADKILNVLGFMEPPVLVNMDLDWDDLWIDFDNNLIDVGVILSHPIPDDVFSGFDVRGVCFGPEVTNADGLTILTGPEYFSGEPFGYMDGLLGAPDSFGNYEGLAGYKYFCEDLDEDEVLPDFFSDPANYANRGMFPAGGIIQRNYNLDWNDSGYDILVFNYAIYANYDWPIGEEPWDVDDWSITAANSAEAFCCSVTETANSLWWSSGVGGGAISLEVEIWDWQGDITDVTIESVEAGIIAVTSYDTAYPGSGAVSTYMYDFLAVSGDPTSMGDLDILITVTDSKTFGECWFLDMLSTGNAMYGELIYNCFTYTAEVIECPVPTVESVDPAGGAGILDDVTFTCTNLIDGASLGVKFVQGTTDFVGTDVTYISGTSMTADFDLAGAATGTCDITITNGCGTEGTGPAIFTVATIIPHSGAPPGGGFVDIDTIVYGSAVDISVQADNEEVYFACDADDGSHAGSDPNDGSLVRVNTLMDTQIAWHSTWVANPISSNAGYGKNFLSTATNSSSNRGIGHMLYPGWHAFSPESLTSWGGTGYVSYSNLKACDVVNSSNQTYSFAYFNFYGTHYRAIGRPSSTWTGASLTLANGNFDGVDNDNVKAMTMGSSDSVLWGLMDSDPYIRRYNSWNWSGWGSGSFGDDTTVINPIDITMDKATSILYVLDSPSGTDYRITAWDFSGNIVAGSGARDDDTGEAYRIDYSEVGDCMYVLFDDNTVQVFKDITNS